MLTRDAWNIAYATLQAVLKLLKPATQTALVSSGLNAASGHWWHVATATAIAPDTLSLKRMRVRDPYTSDKRLRESLQILSAHGFLRPVGGGQFMATDKAQDAINTVIQYQREGFANMQFVPAEVLVPVVAELQKVLAQTTQTTEIPTPALNDVLRRPIEDTQPIMEQFARAVSYLNAFRIDCHSASWKPYKVSGLMWEILTRVWLEEYQTLEILQEALEFRDYRKRDFSDALKKLIKRGWITESEGFYDITPEGREAREEAESATDYYFLQAWSVLPEQHIEELLSRVNDIYAQAQVALQR